MLANLLFQFGSIAPPLPVSLNDSTGGAGYILSVRQSYLSTRPIVVPTVLILYGIDTDPRVVFLWNTHKSPTEKRTSQARGN